MPCTPQLKRRKNAQVVQQQQASAESNTRTGTSSTDLRQPSYTEKQKSNEKYADVQPTRSETRGGFRLRATAILRFFLVHFRIFVLSIYPLLVHI